MAEALCYFNYVSTVRYAMLCASQQARGTIVWYVYLALGTVLVIIGTLRM